MLLALGACTPQQRAAVADGLTAVSRGTAWLASVLDAAEAGSDAYFARHPDGATQGKVDRAILRARLAHEALSAAVAAGEADQLDDRRAQALAAYRALYELLDGLGVLGAIAPAGGVDGGGPDPEPLPLPPPQKVAYRL